jgi:UPF0755 protein
MEKQIQNDTVEPADDPAPIATGATGVTGETAPAAVPPPAKPAAPKKPAHAAPPRQGAAQSTASPVVQQ